MTVTTITPAQSHSGRMAAVRDHLIGVIHGAPVHVQAGYEDHIGFSDAAALADALIASCGHVGIEP